MTTQEVKRKLAAILSADVKGYSRLMGEDEERTVRTLSAYRKIIKNLIQTIGGYLLDFRRLMNRKKGGEKRMKKGLISIGILTVFLLSLMMVSGVFAKDVVEYNPPFGKVTFTHKKHAEPLKIDCLKCHHTWKKGETTGKVCKDCHMYEYQGKTPSIKDAYHKDCIGCHDDAKKANKPAGPTGCTQCHVKAKK